MHLSYLKIKNHPVLKDINLNFINPKNGEPYSIIAFVGENGCGKTTILNELFSYQDSEYIIDKQSPYDVVPRPLGFLYLRQGSLHRNAMNEVGKLITGKDLYKSNSGTYSGGNSPFGLGSNNGINRPDKGIKILSKLNDEQILELFKNNHIDDVYCSNDVSKMIDGKEHGYNISNYSSGQQEILLKIKDLKKMAAGTDCVLLDEPETSLHPRWQKEIVNIVESMMEAGGVAPQMFIATHSEKVLESLIRRDDTLIVRLYKVNGEIKHEDIRHMKLVMPRTTIAELDYVIFKINSMEYCSELYDLLEWKTKLTSEYLIDDYIRRSDYYESDKHYKPWFNDKEKKTTTRSLPSYVRNYFHHPKDKEPPTEKETKEAIILLRKIIKDLI